MLFSEVETADYINKHFEPVWITVRDVPRFTLDFGNGKVVYRTLYGNTATVISTADGEVLDALPGLYNPAIYRKSLEQISLLAKYVESSGSLNDEKLKKYHKRIFNDLSAKQCPSQLLASGNVITIRASRGKLPVVPSTNDLMIENPNISSGKEVQQWNALLAESKYNEAVRRRSIHRHLSIQNQKQGIAFTKWIYRETLHADLDDPYLGLAPVLFAAYPFND